MTTAPNPEPTLGDIAQQIAELREDLDQTRQELRTGDISHQIAELREDLEQSRQDLKGELEQLRQELRTEVERWDERFFQFTRDNLGTSRAIIITAGSVVILSPVLQAFAPAIQSVAARLLGADLP